MAELSQAVQQFSITAPAPPRSTPRRTQQDSRKAIAADDDESAADDIHCPKCGSSDRGIEGYATLNDGTRKMKLKCKNCNRIYRVPIAPPAN